MIENSIAAAFAVAAFIGTAVLVDWALNDPVTKEDIMTMELVDCSYSPQFGNDILICEVED